MRSINDVWVFISLLISSAQNSWVVLTRLVSYSLHLLVVSTSNSLGLINSTSVCQNTLLLSWIARFVVNGQICAVVTTIIRHDSSRVTYIYHKDSLFHEQSNDSARTWLVQHIMAILSESINCVEEVILGFLITIDDSLSRIGWELGIFYDELV